MKSINMPNSVCNVRVRRESPRWQNGVLYVGHEWIEILDEAGQIIWSAGFWPSGNVFFSRGQVHIPDPDQGNPGNTIDIERTPTGRGTAFNCDEKNCADIRECIQERAQHDQADPPYYMLITNNCRNWVTKILTMCCILK